MRDVFKGLSWLDIVLFAEISFRASDVK